MESTNDERKSTVERLIQTTTTALSHRCEVRACALVGTAAIATTVPNDLDFLVFSETGEVGQDTISRLCTDMSATDCHRCDDSYRFGMHDSPSISVAFMSLERIQEQVRDFAGGRNVAGERRVWASGCRLPEGFAGDLAFGRVLQDAEGILSSIRNTLLPYPELARDAILHYCASEIALKLRLLQAEEVVSNAIIYGDIVIALVRSAFAFERRYLRGFKKASRFRPLLSTKEGLELLRAAETAALGDVRQAKAVLLQHLSTYTERNHALE